MQTKPKDLKEQDILDFFTNNQYTQGYELESIEVEFYRRFKAYSQKLGFLVEIRIYDEQYLQIEYLLQNLELLKNKKNIQQKIEVIKDNLMGLRVVVFELCDSCLFEILEDNQLSLEQICALAYQLLSGLASLQESKIIHGNFKKQNILYSASKNQFLISDFEIGGLLDDINSGKHELLGNYFYKSPEAFEAEVIKNNKSLTHKVDIFSIGQILLEAFLQRSIEAYENISLKKKNLFDVIPQLKQSKNQEFVKKILSNMVVIEPNQRLNVSEILDNLNQFKIDVNSLRSLKTRRIYQQNISFSQPQSSLKENLPSDFKQQCIKYNQNEDKVKGFIQFLSGKGYEYINILGKGSFGLVIQASFKNEQIAIKIIEPKNGKDANKLKIEYDLLTNFKKSKHILQIYNALEAKLPSPTLFIFTELCKGELTTLIQQKITKKQIISIMVQLLMGLEQLKQMNVIHMDLKPENILYDTNSNGKNYIIKIADLGQAKQLQNQEYTYNLTNVGARKYMSQEVTELVLDNKSKISYKSDIYSLGIVFIELVFGRKFDFETEVKPIKQGKLQILNERQKTQNRNFDQIDNFLIENVIKNMIQKNPESRKSSDELLDIIFKSLTQNFKENQMSFFEKCLDDFENQN